MTVYRLVAQETVEETVLEMHADKRDLALAVLDRADAAAHIAFDELVALLTAQ